MGDLIIDCAQPKYSLQSQKQHNALKQWEIIYRIFRGHLFRLTKKPGGKSTLSVVHFRYLLVFLKTNNHQYFEKEISLLNRQQCV